MKTGHGGNLRELARQAGLNQDQILDFSASINPLGPPERLRAVLARSIERLVHYPDPDCTELVEFLARRCRVTPEQIVVGNGSTEIFFALARTLPFARAIIPVPSYIDYATAVQAAGRDVCLLKLDEDTGFAIDWDAIEQQLGGNELVFLGQPNNPTGRTFDADLFRSLAARHPATVFVIDEAFADFIDGYQSLADSAAPNVIVVRSLTKFYATAGLRLGFAVANPVLAAQIRNQILPWSVSVLAQDAAVALFSDDDYAKRSIALVDQQRQRLTEELAKLPGLHVYPSVTNFLLVRLNRSDVTAPELAERLLRQGIAIRTFNESQHLDSRHFRVAVRTADENARLCDALALALGVPRPSRAKPRRAASLMLQGTSSNAGKSVLTAALCRILLQDGIRVAPFKSQNMSLNSFVTRDGHEMGRAQVVQAQACRIEPDHRMNPILLKPSSDTGCQVIVRGKPVGNMRVSEYVRYKPEAFAAAKECYDLLAAEYDAVILEGAGSPGEVNLKSHDIVNMQMAEYAASPVLVVGDIDRGGVFASFVGTMEVLAAWERKLIAGWIVNRFRGDASLLGPALDYTLDHTGRPVFGVVPYLPELGLPEEDSVEFKSGALDQSRDDAAVEIAVIDLPHISNFTDFDAFRGENDVRLRIVRSAAELNCPDALIIPGSKNTVGDLEYLRRTGLAERITALARQGTTEIIGICGGLQILGREITDPLGIESAGWRGETTGTGSELTYAGPANAVYGEVPVPLVSRGLELLGVDTVMAAEKTLVRTTARHAVSGLEVSGYEIHHGLLCPTLPKNRSAANRSANSAGTAVFADEQRSLATSVSTTPCNGCESLFTRPDGQTVGIADSSGRVWGTYLHGVFDADAFRRWFIDRLRVRRGLLPVGTIIGRYDIEPALDRLAQVVRASVKMDDIYRLMGLR